MCKGECIFHGPAQDVVAYFSSQGYQCEPYNNPADFALDILTDVGRAQETLAKLSFSYKNSIMHKEIINLEEKYNTVNSSKKLKHLKDMHKPRAVQSVSTEFLYISKRTILNSVRNPGLIMSQIIVSIILGLLIGLVFFDLQNTIDPGIQNRLNAINFIVQGEIFSTLSTLEPLLKERSLFIHVRQLCKIVNYQLAIL